MSKRALGFRCAIAVAMFIPLLFLASCENPFDPLSDEGRIEGLSYIDWAGSWERWDSDPEYDGFVIPMEYYNKFGDALEFRNKSHDIKIEFYKPAKSTTD